MVKFFRVSFLKMMIMFTSINSNSLQKIQYHYLQVFLLCPFITQIKLHPYTHCVPLQPMENQIFFITIAILYYIAILQTFHERFQLLQFALIFCWNSAIIVHMQILYNSKKTSFRQNTEYERGRQVWMRFPVIQSLWWLMISYE